MVRGELKSYGSGLEDKPEIVALSKTDLLDEAQRTEVTAALAAETGAPLFPISAPLGEGMQPLLDSILERLGDAAREQQGEDEPPEPRWSPL